jgi:hypothetical protein
MKGGERLVRNRSGLSGRAGVSVRAFDDGEPGRGHPEVRRGCRLQDRCIPLRAWG